MIKKTALQQYRSQFIQPLTTNVLKHRRWKRLLWDIKLQGETSLYINE